MDTVDWTIGGLIRWTQEFFAGRGLDSARLEAEILLAHTLGLQRIELYTNFDRPVTETERADFRGLVRRRAERCPTAYLTGVRGFMSLEFRVTPDVLIPRPDTEHLVEAVLERVASKQSKPLIADIGTGSGCICIALAARLPDARFIATDISEAALAVAGENAQRHGVEDRIKFVRGDMLKPLKAEAPAGKIDFILSNPPYISEEEWPGLMPEVREHEPRQALLAEGDPLRYYSAIAEGAEALLAPGGCLIFEVGAGRAAAVTEICKEKLTHCDVSVVKDYAGIERIVIAEKHGNG